MATVTPNLSTLRDMTPGERRLGQRLETLLEDDYILRKMYRWAIFARSIGAYFDWHDREQKTAIVLFLETDH